MTHRNDLLTTRQAAHRVGLSPRTPARRCVTGDGPVFLKVGRRVLYREADPGSRPGATIELPTETAGPRQKRAGRLRGRSACASVRSWMRRIGGDGAEPFERAPVETACAHRPDRHRMG